MRSGTAIEGNNPIPCRPRVTMVTIPTQRCDSGHQPWPGHPNPSTGLLTRMTHPSSRRLPRWALSWLRLVLPSSRFLRALLEGLVGLRDLGAVVTL